MAPISTVRALIHSRRRDLWTDNPPPIGTPEALRLYTAQTAKIEASARRAAKRTAAEARRRRKGSK